MKNTGSHEKHDQGGVLDFGKLLLCRVRCSRVSVPML